MNPSSHNGAAAPARFNALPLPTAAQNALKADVSLFATIAGVADSLQIAAYFAGINPAYLCGAAIGIKLLLLPFLRLRARGLEVNWLGLGFVASYAFCRSSA
jgi:hypothetical protein